MAFDDIAPIITPFGRRKKLLDFGDDGERTEPTPEEESFLRQLGSGTLTGVQAIAQVLDTPGAMVRALLSGKNPLSAAVNPEERVYGQQMMFGPESSGAGEFMGGLGLDILLDPLTYVGGLGLLGRSLGTGGRVAQRAGLMDRLAMGAVKGPGLGMATGPRRQLMKTTLRDLLDSVPAAERAAARSTAEAAAQKMGVKSFDNLLDKPLGGGFHARIPFTNTEYLPTGKAAEAFAAWRDKLGETVRYGRYSPMRSLAALFDPAMRGTTDPVAQRIMKAAAAQEARRLPQAMENVFRVEGNIERAGLQNVPHGAIRQAAEFPANAPAALRQALDPAHRELAEQIAESQARGLGMGQLSDKTVGYWPRQRAAGINAPATRGMGAMAGSAHDIARERWLMEIPGGTETLNQASEQAANILKAGGRKRDITRMLEGMGIPNDYTTRSGAVKTGRRAKIANMFMAAAAENTPDVLTPGYFSNHPVFDLAKAMPGQVRTLTTRNALVNALGDQSMLDLLSNKRYAKDTWIPTQKAIKRLGLANQSLDTIAQELSQQTGKAYTAAEVGKMKLPSKLLDDLKGTDMISGPRAAKGMLKAYDQFTNLFKAGTLLHPAQWFRNLTGGQVQNAIQQQIGGLAGSQAVMAGKTLADWADYAKLPAVREYLQASGKQASAETVTDAIREMSAARGLFSPLGLSADTVIPGTAIDRGMLSDIAQQVPGRTKATVPFSKEWFKTFLGKEKGTTLKPIQIKGGLKSNLRGILDAPETTFGPVKASEQVGYYSEGLNRLGPFLKLLKEGFDPTTAAHKITESQVRYNNALTPFEREIMARFFPYYRFGKGMTKHTASELANRPGGPLAQVIRATAEGVKSTEKDRGIVPEHVAETMAIPIKEGDFLGKLLGVPTEKGVNRYLTGLGLMHEDALKVLGPLATYAPLAASFALPIPGLSKLPAAAQLPIGGAAAGVTGQFLPLPWGVMDKGPGLKDAVIEMLSRSNPLIKAAYELPTGQSTFQRGPEGGRPLEELDPTLGRTLANIQGLESPVGTPSALEYLIGMSPATRVATTARILSDPRKDMVSKLINSLTGIRTTDVSPSAQDALLRQMLSKGIREVGGKTFTTPYFSKQQMEAMTPAQKLEAEKYMEVRKLLQRRQKARTKERDKQPTA